MLALQEHNPCMNSSPMPLSAAFMNLNAVLWIEADVFHIIVLIMTQAICCRSWYKQVHPGTDL